MEATDAATALTSSLNGYNLEAQDAMKIVDQLTTLDLKYATSAGDIANAMSKVSSSASSAGISLERLEAILTVTADKTQQAPETIGRAWNSVIQRINKISAGKDVSDTGMALNDVDKVLTKLGLTLKDENGIIKDTSVILDEVAEKWNTWNRNEQNQIATAIAGTNQANIFRATMEDYEEVLTATEIAENANGSATERMAIYTESLTAKINSLKTAWTQFVNNLNLDGAFGGLIDIATKFIEILDILLNKIPILSDVLKTLITVQGINILAGATVKAINKIAGQEGIAGLLSGLVSIKGAIGQVGTAATTSSAGIGTMSAALSALGISANTALGIVGVLITTIAAGYYVWDNFISIEGRLENANKKLEESQADLDETQSKVDELLSEKEELESISTDYLTSGEKQRLEIINEQLTIYQDILDTKKQIAEQDEEQVKKLEYESVEGKYTGNNSLSYNRDSAENIVQSDYSAASSYGASSSQGDTKSISPLLASQNTSFASNLAKQEQLLQLYKELSDGEEKYGYTIEGVNNAIEQNNQILQEQVINLEEDKAMLIENGQTGTEEYKNLCEQLEVYKALMNPDDWEDNTIQNLVDFDSVIDEIEKGGQEAANVISQTAEDVARQINNDQALKSAAEVAFSIDLDTVEGYNELVRILSEDIPKAYQTASEAASESTLTAASVFTSYLDTVETLTESQTTLNTALGEMQNSGELTVDTVRDLISAYPELSNKISIQNGQLKIEVQYLNEVWEAQKNKEKNTIDSQINETESVIENTRARIEAYTTEAEALNAMAQAGDSSAQRVQYLKEVMESNPTDSTAYINAAREFGSYMTQQNLQMQKQTATLERLKAAREALDNIGGLSSTSSGSSGSSSSGSTSSSNPEKEAYELKKSEIEVIQDQLELQKDILEAKKDEIENEKDSIELNKDKVQLLKDQAEQQLEIVQDAEESLDNIIEMIEDMINQDYEDLKSNLENISTFIDEFKDALDDVKDTYDDIVQDAKDKLEAEKEAADNQREIEDKIQSVAEIQAQLQEIAYDDSADAMAQRAELTAELNEAQQEMQETIEDQSYDSAIDALDATSEKVDDVFEQINDILDISQDSIQEYIDYISDVLQSDGNLYKAALEQFNNTSDGAREELYNKLIEWNSEYGDNINETVTSAWNDAIEAVEKYKEAVGTDDISGIREYLAQQDTSISNQIETYEQQINQFDNTISQLDISISEVDQSVSELEEVINRIKMSLSQLDIDYNTSANATEASAQGVNTGTQYAWEMVKSLLTEAGIDTQDLPQSYDELLTAIQDGTLKITDANESITGLSDSAEQASSSVDTLSVSEDSATTSTSQMSSSAQDSSASVDALGSSADVAAQALDGVSAAGSETSSGSSFNIGNMIDLLTGGDVGTFIGNIASKLIVRYLPTLLRSGIDSIIKNHDGTSYVTKNNSWLDQMLGLGQDETARILKVGEAVIPDYANNLSDINKDTISFSRTSTHSTPNIKSNNNSSLNIDMGDLDISGIDVTELRNELENIKNDSANKVYQTLSRYIKVGGYRNVKNRYN